MRVCIVSSKECWQDGAGVWWSVGGFPSQMAAIGSLFDEMTLLVVLGAPRSGGARLPAHARVHPLRRPSGVDARRKLSVVSHLVYYFRAMARHLRSADVAHVPLPGDMSFLGMVTALVLRKRLLARYGGSWESTSETTLMNRVTQGCMRLFAGGRNVMLATGCGMGAPSPGMGWVFATTISESELKIIRPDFNRPVHNPLRLAYVGRLSPEKGVSHLIAALGLLRSDRRLGRQVPRLTIIGDGVQRLELVALVERHRCEGSVYFAGQLARRELLELLLQTDVCVLPSLTEGFPKARLDAMICGVPVVTTEVGFGREIVGGDGERGWLVPASDANALAGVLRNLVTDPIEWRGVRERCRRYAERFTLEAWAQTIGERCAEQWRVALVNGRLVA